MSTVLPGSDAAKAVADVSKYVADKGSNLLLPELESYTKERMIAYGVDPVTSAASAHTVKILSEQNPTNTSRIAEDIVGRTVSDPNTIGERISANVASEIKNRGGIANLSKDEQKALADTEVDKALNQAGITDTQSHADAKNRVHEYIDQGASPEVAATAAAAPALAQAGPKADSLSIFGYLVMLVHGDVKYVFKNTETLKVGDSAIHSHMQNVNYKMDGYTFHVKCQTIQTSSTSEFLNVRPHFGFGIGEYPGEYKSINSTSFSFFLLAGKTGMQWSSYGLYSFSGTKQRIYLAGIDNDMVLDNRGIKVTNGPGADERKSIFTGEMMGKGIERAIERIFK